LLKKRKKGGAWKKENSFDDYKDQEDSLGLLKEQEKIGEKRKKEADDLITQRGMMGLDQLG